MPITSRGKGYPIPDDPEPEGYYCVRVYVPHDQLYMGIFWQSLHYLASPRAWANDADHTAIVAAEVWKTAIQKSQEIDVCGEGDCGIMDVRQNTEPCKLDKLDDCSGEWEQFADMRLCVPKMRIANGMIQQDTTGAGNWVDASEESEPIDDRTDGPYTPAWETPPEGEDGQCLAAVNAVAWFRARVQQICYANRDYQEFLTWFSVLVAALALLSGVGLIVVVLSGALIAIVETFVGGPEDWGDAGAFDFTNYVKCLFYDAFSADGTMTQAAWEALEDAIYSEAALHEDEAERVAITLCGLLVWAAGPVGVSRVANWAGITTSDCSDDCATFMHTFDFTTSNGGWAQTTRYGTEWECGVWSDGNGWLTQDKLPTGIHRRQLVIKKEFDTRVITKIKLYYTRSCGSFYDDDWMDTYRTYEVDTMKIEEVKTSSSCDTGTQEWEDDSSCDELELWLSTCKDLSDWDGSCVLTRVDVWGNGYDPF